MAEIISLNEVRKKKMLHHAALAERAIDPEQLLTLELLDRIAINLADYRKGRAAQVAPTISQRNDKKAIIQTLLNDIAANIGVDLSAPAPSKGKPKR